MVERRIFRAALSVPVNRLMTCKVAPSLLKFTSRSPGLDSEPPQIGMHPRFRSTL